MPLYFPISLPAHAPSHCPLLLHFCFIFFIAPALSKSPLLLLFCLAPSPLLLLQIPLFFSYSASSPFPAPFHSSLLYHLPLRFSLFQFTSLLFFCSASFLFRSFLSGIQCRSGWLNHGSSCYHFSHDQETWINAEVRSINIKRFPFESYIFTITLSHTLLYTKQCKVKLAYRIYYVLSIVKINRKFSCYFS